MRDFFQLFNQEEKKNANDIEHDRLMTVARAKAAEEKLKAKKWCVCVVQFQFFNFPLYRVIDRDHLSISNFSFEIESWKIENSIINKYMVIMFTLNRK